ncbi:MAG: hypothetical protein J3R72DRAFT_455162 [Linnemannia gamsii]|nr:MAG: hypothetical protein J3R72DRAFT_455162 [Linnemannia gamsii]
MTLTSTYSNSIAHSTISSTSSNSFKMTVKPCVAKGHRECVQGFLRDRCCKCTKGSVSCGMCPSNSSNSCIFCVDGRKECDDCYGAGFIQRICRDCIKAHYRRQSNPKTFSLTKVTEQSKTAVSNLSESFLGLVKGTQQQSIQKHHQRSGSSVSLPESIASTASSEHSTASAPSPSRGGSKGGFFLKRLSLDHERTSASSPATASTSSPSSPNKHRRKWSWSSILTAA